MAAIPQIGIYSLIAGPVRDFPAKSLVHVFPSFDVGGAQRRLLQLMIAYGNSYRHTVVSLSGDYEMASQVPASVPVSFAGAPPRTSLATLPGIGRYLSRLRPDTLVTHNWGAIEWAFANRFWPRIRHVHIEDGFGPEERVHQLKRRVLFRRLALGGQHTRVVLPSQKLLTIALDQWRLDRGAVQYIPNGIDCARFAVPRDTGRSGGRLVVGTIAALRPEKNLGRLIRAFVDVRKARPDVDWKFLVVGEGAERKGLEDLARAQGIAGQMEFTGATEFPEKYLSQMDIFCLSSDTEQMPLGVLEAMASALPVVSTDVGDVATMVSPGNAAFVTKLDDQSGLARSILALSDNAVTRQSLGEANKAKAFAEFDYRIMAKAYAAVFG